MRFDILTLFPDFFTSPLTVSLTARALEKKIITVNLHDIRQAGIGKHKQVDDRPFGGGPGMVLKADVLEKSLKQAIKTAQKQGEQGKPYVILLDPAGHPLKQSLVQNLAKKHWLILICGHYEGVDERFKTTLVDEEISIGDYVLGGGEAAALVIVDTVSRLTPGFLGKAESALFESFSKVKLDIKETVLLDYPTYTRPENFQGKTVPKTLLSGDHPKIKKWRLEKALAKTKKRRPDLLRKQKAESS